MKKSRFSFVLSCSLMLCAPLWAQTVPEKVQKARELVAAPVTAQKSWEQSAQLSRNKRDAAQLFFEAASEATDAAQKFEWALEAGELWRREFRPEEAAKAYNLALENSAKADPEKRGQAALYAATTFQQSLYASKDAASADLVKAQFQKSLLAKPVSPARKAELHKEFGAFLAKREAWFESAKNYEQAGILTPPDYTKSPSEQDMHFYNAAQNAQKLPPSPQVKAFLEGVFERRLTIESAHPDPKNRPYALGNVREGYAKAMLSQGASEKALGLWKQVGAQSDLPFDVRYRILKGGAGEFEKAKNWNFAAQLWGLAGAQTEISGFWEREARGGEAEALAKINKWKDARAALGKIADSPKHDAATREEWTLKIADFYTREALSLPKSGAQGTAVAGAMAILNPILARAEVAPKTLQTALLERAEIETRLGDPEKARADLVAALPRFGANETTEKMAVRTYMARILAHQGQFRAALDAIPEAKFNSWGGTTQRPDTNGWSAAEAIWSAALGAKNWDAANYFAEKARVWGVDSNSLEIIRLENEVAQGHFAAARTRAAELEKKWLSPQLKSRLQSLKTKIPAA